jgi:hypothetical protein
VTTPSIADDELAIRNLLARVAHLTDGRGGNLDDYVELWTDDCTWSSPVAGTWHGHDGHRSRHERFRKAGVQGPGASSFHVLTTVWVDVQGEEADALSTWMLVTRWSGAPSVEDIGTYTDRLRRGPTGWRLATRMVEQGDGAWLRAREAASRKGD